jgi:lysyl oxidase-like protein 2/3/4
MEVFATFDVMDSKGVKVAEGHKASFCLEDNQCMPGVKPFYACANFGDQGISVNCSDIYRHNIDCQWVDISELNPGMYTFKVSYFSEDSSKKTSYVLCIFSSVPTLNHLSSWYSVVNPLAYYLDYSKPLYNVNSN